MEEEARLRYPHDIKRSLSHVAKEDRRYKVPDALGHQDYLDRPDLLCDLAAARGAVDDLGSWRPRRYGWFPYPKDVGGHRRLTTVDIVDRVVYRILAFGVAAVTDPALSGQVFGNRLERSGSWSLRPTSSAWGDYIGHQVSSLKENDWAYTCVSDLSGFYLGIDTDLLCASMREHAVSEKLVVPIRQVLSHWQDAGDLTGLPMGGEASGVLSNVYLLSVDHLLGTNARDYAMYGDDLAVFDSEATRGRGIILALDEQLNRLSLKRNSAKTNEFLDAVEAVQHIQNDSLASIDVIDQVDDDMATEMLYQLWDERVMAVPRPNMSEVRFALGRLGKRKDAYAVPGLLSRRDLLQTDPRSTVEYLTVTVGRDQDVAEELCSLLSAPPTPTSEALQLHVCRFLACSDRGSAIAVAVERVPDDGTTFRAMTRAMAAQARRRCPRWRYDDAIDRADAERDFVVRRSLIGTTKGMAEHVPTRRLALRELARRDSALATTAAWALAA